jgi:hypothetical protein
MTTRFKTVLLARRLRIDFDIPMRSWWWNLAIPYVITGKTPKLGPEWMLFK